TRVTAVLTFLGTLSYINRNSGVLFGMDTMQTILLFYLMVGPSGAALSVDRLVGRHPGAPARERAGGAAGGLPPRRAGAVGAGQLRAAAGADPLLLHLHGLRPVEAQGPGLVGADGHLVHAGQPGVLPDQLGPVQLRDAVPLRRPAAVPPRD